MSVWNEQVENEAKALVDCQVTCRWPGQAHYMDCLCRAIREIERLRKLIWVERDLSANSGLRMQRQRDELERQNKLMREALEVIASPSHEYHPADVASDCLAKLEKLNKKSEHGTD